MAPHILPHLEYLPNRGLVVLYFQLRESVEACWAGTLNSVCYFMKSYFWFFPFFFVVSFSLFVLIFSLSDPSSCFLVQCFVLQQAFTKSWLNFHRRAAQIFSFTKTWWQPHCCSCFISSSSALTAKKANSCWVAKRITLILRFCTETKRGS